MNRTIFATLMATLLGAGCGAASDFGDVKCAAVISPSADTKANRTAIQGAIGAAMPGAVICLNAGVYPLHDEIDISTANLELRGPANGSAILDFNGQAAGANGVSVVSADGFKITSLTVKNTPGDAIRVTQTKGVTFTSVTVTWDGGAATSNGAYGLYPVQCQNVLIDKCSVSFAADAGIYVGQSANILVRGSEAFGNVAGIEIENSVGAEVTNNYSHDNTGGVLVFGLPNLMSEGSSAANVHDNKVIHNNGMNFAARSGIVSHVPSGSGLLVISSDNNEIHNNTITDNDSAGFAVVSYLVLQMPFTDAQYDPYPAGNSVHDNTFMGNGLYPSGIAATLAAAAGQQTVTDLVWDGIVDPSKAADPKRINCFDSNGAATFTDLGIDDKGNFHPSTNLAPYTCKHDSLPAIKP